MEGISKLEGFSIEAGRIRKDFELAKVILRGLSGTSPTPAFALHQLVWGLFPVHGVGMGREVGGDGGGRAGTGGRVGGEMWGCG